MSDHEGDGEDIDRWEDASLPGGTVFSYVESDVAHQAINSRNTTFYPSTGRRNGPQRGFHGKRQNGFNPALARISEQPIKSNQPRLPPAPAKHQARHLVFKSPWQLQAEKGQPPNDQYQILTPTWKALEVMALRVERAAQPHPKEILKQIMGRTETFIKEPAPNDQVLYIWGEDAAATEARIKLAEWERDVRDSSRVSKPASWLRNKALDGRAEHREERQNQQKLLKDLMQSDHVEYPVEAALLWPKEGVDIEDFERNNADVLDQLRGMYDCRISFTISGTPHVAMATQSQEAAADLMKRMMNLIKEAISGKNALVTINTVHVPSFDVYRDRVGLLDRDPKTESFHPTLHGELADDEAQLEQQRRQTQTSNRRKIKKALDNLIKKLRVSEHHVRMRVVYGELGFTRFQKPPTGTETFSFEDFLTMVTTQGRTKLKLNGLPVHQGDITNLPDILDEMEAFSDREEYYAAFCDFPGTTQRSWLRLENVFTPMGVDETEYREKRWLEVGDSVSKLQVSHLNFDRPDYQVTVDAFPSGAGRLPKALMHAFQGNVSMERPMNGVKSDPRRRVKHPNERGLHYVSELIMLKWRFKNTDGVFELRRKDLYDLRPGMESASPAETRWHGLYYYPAWDNLLGEFASVRPGEDVQWSKSLLTFFPVEADEWSALPKGFKTFMTEVEEVQDLLAQAIRRLAKGKGTAT